MIYHIAALRKKAYAAELRKSETINGRLQVCFLSRLSEWTFAGTQREPCYVSE